VWELTLETGLQLIFSSTKSQQGTPLTLAINNKTGLFSSYLEAGSIPEATVQREHSQAV
jgi:hypothetical protein